MITVIIPYFQRDAGVLRRALRSVTAQRDCPLPVRVLVVDDASPAPPGPEIDAAGTAGDAVQVLRRPNGGPGAARNTGLDNAPTATRYIAFLDSDDEWTPDHLARAVRALQAGFDLYFADHYQLGQTVGAFARAGRIDPAEHLALPEAGDGLHAYRGDLLDQIIRGNVIGTSTVVYDRHRFPRQRFRAEFANAGEDYLFWMSLARDGARTAFSSRVGATYGKGVNVYSGAAWGSEQHLRRIHDELRFLKTVAGEFPLTPLQAQRVRKGISNLRKAFAAGLLHRLRHLESTSVRLLLLHLRLDPASYARLPANAWSLMLDKR